MQKINVATGESFVDLVKKLPNKNIKSARLLFAVLLKQPHDHKAIAMPVLSLLKHLAASPQFNGCFMA